MIREIIKEELGPLFEQHEKPLSSSKLSFKQQRINAIKFAIDRCERDMIETPHLAEEYKQSIRNGKEYLAYLEKCD